jgi:CheY-like chemotaxis protein
MERPDSPCLIILVVDDNDDARLSLAEYLEEFEGFHVETAADGLQAIDLTLAKRPAVVVMDLVMPLMDGVEAIRLLKASPSTRKIPILVLTAFRPEDDAPQRAIAAGATEIITKPADPKFVASRVRRHCPNPPPPPAELPA